MLCILNYFVNVVVLDFNTKLTKTNDADFF